MLKLLEPNDIVEAIENAFRPLECRVELYDQGSRLAFNVLDAGSNLLLPLSVWRARLVRRPERLRARIAPLRDRVALEGYTLDPWNFPDLTAPQ